MNLMGAFFSVGACIAPFIMTFSSNITSGWKYVCYGVSAAAAIGILITMFMRFDNNGTITGADKRGDLSFFKRKKYWVTLFALLCYTGMEISIIGWTATFFMEAQNTTSQFASLMTTLLWLSTLVGRIVCSFISSRTTATKLILYLSIGVAAFMALFVSKIGLNLQIIATIGLGLFMSGTYSTILADAGPIFSEYKLAFGYFFMLSGLGPTIMPAIIGLVTERHGIRIGIRVLAVAATALLVFSIVNTRLEKKSARADNL